jgi:hypothetical protein
MAKQVQSTHVQQTDAQRQAQHDAKDDADLAKDAANESVGKRPIQRRSSRAGFDKDGGEESIHGRKQKGTVEDR